MKKTLILSLMFATGIASANTLCWVSSYTKQNGTFVSSYIRQQTACVKSTPVMATAENLAVLKAVAYLGAILGLMNAREDSLSQEISVANRKIYNCPWPENKKYIGSNKSKDTTVFLTSEKAYTLVEVDNPFLKSITNILDKESENSFKRSALMGYTTFDSSTNSMFHKNVFGDEISWSCKLTHEIEITG